MALLRVHKIGGSIVASSRAPLCDHCHVAQVWPGLVPCCVACCSGQGRGVGPRGFRLAVRPPLLPHWRQVQLGQDLTQLSSGPG